MTSPSLSRLAHTNVYYIHGLSPGPAIEACSSVLPPPSGQIMN